MEKESANNRPPWMIAELPTTSDSPAPPAPPWSDSFGVGIAALDSDHRNLVERINEICGHARAGRRDHALEVFGALHSEAAAHFEREEAVLRKLSGYDHVESHAGEHRNRLKELESLRHQYEAITDAAQAAGICDDLVHWFVRQSIGHDAQIKSFTDDRGVRMPQSRGSRPYR